MTEVLKTDRLVWSCEEARKQLGISRGLFYEAIHRGEIPHVRIGKRILIYRVSLEKMLEGNKHLEKPGEVPSGGEQE